MRKATTPSEAATGSRWSYVPRPGHWDEAFRPTGLVRRPWRQLAVDLRRMGAKELGRRWQTGRELIELNGVTYNVYGDPQGRERPWQLDPIPLIIDGPEWAEIERAVAQRARLLNAILRDVYGPQRLLKERLLPPAVVFSNPAFIRPCVGIEPLGGVHLHTLAVDLARSPYGQWWAISDRTQSPSGMGYALENRLVSARTLPVAFNQSQVLPLSAFFERRGAALQQLGLARSRDPRVVVMTPGPHNETYFEHSFLAHQWGFPLVEGADLMVRDNEVFLKTLSGPERVDVILRRTDDTFCDPLELRGDSLLGVPGLMQAYRHGNVAIANSIGSGLAETPAHMGFLPNLCPVLLGEDLRMPSVATWWCGQPDAFNFVASHLEQLVVKPAAHLPGAGPEFPAEMSPAQREALIRRMAAHPERFVAQEQVALSTAPTHQDGALVPRHVVMRVFATWDGAGYAVMPGGLTRVSNNATSLVVSMQMGGGSKDTWVLGTAEQVEQQMEGHASGPEIHVQGARQAALSSRMADNLFWLGRYTERVEAGVRLVRALLPSLSGESDFGGALTIETTVGILSALSYLPPEFAGMGMAQQRWQLERLLGGMVYDATRIGGIGWNVKNVRRVAWPLKERLSQDTWRVLQQLDQELSVSQPVQRQHRLTAQIDLLDRVIVTLSAFNGLLNENTTREHGWRFLWIGKRLERALQIVDLVLAGFASSEEDDRDGAMQALLRIADSSITYRSRYFTTLRPEFVMDLLWRDHRNPRSFLFQLEALAERMAGLPGYSGVEVVPKPLLLTEALLQKVRSVTAERLVEEDADGNLTRLAEQVNQVKGDVYDISDALAAQHFNLLASSRFV